MAEKVACESCGKLYTKQGLVLHRAYCKGSEIAKIEPEPKPALENAAQGSEKAEKKTDAESSVKKYREGSMVEQYNEHKEHVEPKKEVESASKEANYTCGACNEEFYSAKRPKHCPECGVEF